jgi:hypothetical protein
MPKIIELIPASALQLPVECLPGVASRMAVAAEAEGLVLDIADQRPAGSPEPPYAAVIEAWFRTVEDYLLARGHLAPALRNPDAVVAYAVTERIQKEHQVTRRPGLATPGVKAVYLVRRLAQLSDNEARQRWRSHAAIAREHHTGMSRYVQNAVRQRLGPDAPVYHGIAVLHFPSIEDLEQHMYDSEEGRRKVQEDVQGLVAESLPLYTTELILRQPGG